MRNLGIAAIIAATLSAPVNAEDTKLRMATIAPSLGASITMATFANVVNENIANVEIEVSAGGAATLHQLEVGRGNLELAMTSPVIYNLMAGGKAMYTGEADAPESAEGVRLLMWFPWGPYHFAVRGDSDIEFLDDLEGTTVFLGPQGGGAYNGAKGWIEATTGLVAGEDYEAIAANWQTGFQAFLDGKVDMYVNGCLDPCGQFIQFTETEQVRFLAPAEPQADGIDEWLGPFRYRDTVQPGQYDGQLNEDAIESWNTAVGIAVSADVDEEVVYSLTKAFWDNLDQVTSDAPWAKALDVAFAAESRGQIQLHPGAARYYREAGVIE